MSDTARDEAEDFLARAGLDRGAMDKLRQEGFWAQPASKGHHLNGFGGLREHSLNVTKRLLQLTETLGVRWPRPESPYLVGMLHDLVKCRCYKLISPDPVTWQFVQPEYPGHGWCSAAIAAELGIELLPEEIAAITYHMGMFGVGKEYVRAEFESALASEAAPCILATIFADWWAARVDETKTETKIEIKEEKK